jgi:hypothetical protein
MKFHLALILLVILFACNNKTEKVQTTPTTSTAIIEDTTANYFPVTNFLLGDINSIKTNAGTPQYKITTNGKTDSSYINMDSIFIVFQDFLAPRIDSANLKKYFREKSFLDQTLGTFTFTYDRRANTSFDFPFTNWDVMINEETQKVKRIYLVKKVDAATKKLLTWQAEKWCKIVTITNDKVVKEEKYIWNYDEE